MPLPGSAGTASVASPCWSCSLGVVLLYVNPVRSYVSTWQESKSPRGRGRRARGENERLRERRDELRDPRALEREARRLGMVRPGERAYVVEGLGR